MLKMRNWNEMTTHNNGSGTQNKTICLYATDFTSHLLVVFKQKFIKKKTKERNRWEFVLVRRSNRRWGGNWSRNQEEWDEEESAEIEEENTGVCIAMNCNYRLELLKRTRMTSTNRNRPVCNTSLEDT